MIEDVISLIREKSSPSSGDNLIGFHIDVEAAFCGNDAFAEVETSPYGETSSMIRIRASISPKVKTIQDIGSALSKVMSEIGYGHFQAHSIGSYQEAVVLRFVSVMARHNLFVTGTAVVTGLNYPELVAQYNSRIGHQMNPLQPYVGGLPDWSQD